MTKLPATTKALLQKYWGHTAFRGSQEHVIRQLLEGKDVLALMPTGGGKSLCYQLPALHFEGITLVISPLIALMQDQVTKLRKMGIKAVALTGRLRHDEIVQVLDNVEYGNYKILYLSPERLKKEWIVKRLSEMNVSLIAIDEAHCISQWGHDFRPAYMECAQLRSLYPDAPLIALTATATEQVVGEIVNVLELRIKSPVIDSFNRQNLTYEVLRHHNKQKALIDLIQSTSRSVIVYVRTRRETHRLANLLNTNNVQSVYYHGGLDTHLKEKAMKAWLNDTAQVMVATTAFGMGIDKPDVELVVHFAIPESLESYFQEAGRAGRDGKPARAVLIHAPVDVDQARQQFTANLVGTKEIKQLYKHLVNYLQVAYGEGAEESFPFDFQNFCERYGISNHMAFEGLRTLDRLGIVLLSEDFQNKTHFRYTAGKDQLWQYMEQQPEVRKFHETLVRSYGGIFDHEVALNLSVLAKRMSTKTEEVTRFLTKAQTDGIAEVAIQNTDLNLTFAVPREDDHTIIPYKEIIEKNKERKISRLEDMIRYLGDNRKCRSIQLLAYFGEQSERKCGQCDVCQESNSSSPEQLEGRKSVIMEMLQKRVMTLSDIHASLGKSKAEALQCVQELLEDEKIAVNAENQYYPL